MQVVNRISSEILLQYKFLASNRAKCLINFNVCQNIENIFGEMKIKKKLCSNLMKPVKINNAQQIVRIVCIDQKHTHLYTHIRQSKLILG